MTNLDTFSLPNIDNTLDLLAEAKYFTTLDFASSYLQVRIDPASGEKTAFTTYPTLYEFNKMPFGLVNAISNIPSVDGVCLGWISQEQVYYVVQ